MKSLICNRDREGRTDDFVPDHLAQVIIWVLGFDPRTRQNHHLIFSFDRWVGFAGFFDGVHM